MLRLVILLAVLVLSAGAAWADPASDAASTALKAADNIATQGGIYGSIAVVVGLAVAAGFVVLGLVIRALWRTIAARDIIISGLQEKRASDAATSSKLLAEVATTGSASISANTAAQAELTNRMQAFADLVRPLGPDHGRILSALDRNAEKIDECGKAIGENGGATTRAIGDCTIAIARIRGAA